MIWSAKRRERAFAQVYVAQPVYKVYEYLKPSVPRETGNIRICVTRGRRRNKSKVGTRASDGQPSRREAHSSCSCSLSRALSFPFPAFANSFSIPVPPPSPLALSSSPARIGVFAKIPVLNVPVPDYSYQVNSGQYLR